MFDIKDIKIKQVKQRDKTIKYTTYRCYCDDCGIDKAIYHTKNMAAKYQRCLSCAGKHRIQQYGNPMLNKHHTNLSKFRKTYPNVNYDDFQLRKNSERKNKRFYRMTCKTCGKDRGYLTHYEATRSCTTCHSNRQRRKTPIQRKIYGCIKANINSRLKHRTNHSISGIFRFLPYTLNQFMEHIEKQFEPWMNWNNHGLYDPTSVHDLNKRTWQIDHIIPDSAFNYSSKLDTEFFLSWALENLRPLESLQNIIKSDKNNVSSI